MENGATPKQTPSRRSCLICAAAKVKCISSESGSGSGAGDCDRCRRLGKECVMQAVVPRKPRTRKKTTYESSLLCSCAIRMLTMIQESGSARAKARWLGAAPHFQRQRARELSFSRVLRRERRRSEPPERRPRRSVRWRCLQEAICNAIVSICQR